MNAIKAQMFCTLIALTILNLNDCYIQIGNYSQYLKYGLNREFCGYRTEPEVYKINFTPNCFRNTYYDKIQLLDTSFGSEWCGHIDPNSPISRVAKGVEGRYLQAPWAVLIKGNGIRRKSNGWETIQYSCSGVLITLQFALTAAHCRRQKDDTLWASTGNPKLKPLNQILVYDFDWFPHKDFETYRANKSGIYSRWDLISVDLALVRLYRGALGSRPLKDSANRYFVNPICLPERNQRVPIKTQLVFYGFGLIGPEEEPRCYHMGTFNNVFHVGGGLKVQFFNDQTCPGDSGGGLVQYNKHRAILFGVCHGGDGTHCGNAKIGRFADVSLKIDWILDIITQHTQPPIY